ncbi:flagellar biosynthetic protein FliR [Shewanella intestini]|uniref:Flagellar biosynthetic protein FliR n=1 Tax=Shewanella intestini TaxID=2017544 RepID=A0ABS5I0H7_9GAMM|nr:MULTISPECIES: flagellar biosynthetic protein FliR [Shewanella]MBR9727338.1 flagellar type III secretion system protein FliR [Shewanella intestini]MRG35612.1 flagellar type III secretion system protein FliR [Shewanella sp. XMDDZSB0408]
MEILFAEISQALAAYLLPFFRISSMLMVMAVFGANTTPARVRLLLSVAITVAVAPVLPPLPEIDLIAFSTVFIIAQQIIVGVAMGFVTLMVMQTFVLTGQIIGMQTSLGFASMIDPSSGQQTPVVGNFFLLLATLIFLAVDGHLLMFKMLVASFETIPISMAGISIKNYWELANWGGYMFGAALTMSLSAIVALLMINLSFGVMTRASPQLNIFSIGFPVTMVSGLFILWLTLSPIMAHFSEVWLSGQLLMCDLLHLQCQIDRSATY